MSALQEIPAWFVNAIVFVLGSIVGSFLNVCIYRMPKYESVVHPGSHCPRCGAAIPWYHNIPIVSYVWLRGRASCCGGAFSVRYWVVELTTASVFLLLWLTFPAAVAVAYIVFLCFLIVATATDLELYIIPDEITYGGAAAGLIFSAMIPQLHGQVSRLKSAGISLAGFLVAFLVLWGVVELGKLIFGRKKHVFDAPVEITAAPEGLSTAEEKLAWDDIFSRESDQLRFVGKDIRLQIGSDPARAWENAAVALSPDGVTVGEEKFEVSDAWSLKALTREIIVPREAMGFGDVKFIGCIGAFLGPFSLFFVILVSSLVGSVVGLFLLAIGKRQWGGKLPYGPFLALAAVCWIFFDYLAPEWSAKYREFIQVLLPS